MGNAPKTRSRSNRNRRARSPSSRRLATPKLGNFDHVYKLRQVADESDQPEPPRTPVTPTLGDLDKLYISPARSEASVFGGLKELRRNSVPDSPAVPGTLEHLRRSLVATIGTDPNPAVAELPPAGFRQRESNPCLSSSEDGSCVGLRDDASLAGAAVSGSSTTATTPEVSPLDNKEDQNDISDLECGAVLEANGGKFKPSIHPPSAKAALYVPLPPGVVIEQGRMRQISARYGLLPLFSELGQTRRRQIAQIVAGHRRSSAAEDIFLPWDMNGNYFPGLCPKGFYSTSTQTGWPNQHGVAFDPDFISRTDIQSLYSVQKDVQLKIIRAILDDTIDEDDLLRASVHTRGRATQPIHVFVDASNIIIGFSKFLPARRAPLPSVGHSANMINSRAVEEDSLHPGRDSREDATVFLRGFHDRHRARPPMCQAHPRRLYDTWCSYTRLHRGCPQTGVRDKHPAAG